MARLPVGCTVALVQRNKAFTLLSIILIVVGIVLVIYGAINCEDKTTTRKTSSEYLGVVIDAGGSGTRLTVYSYEPGERLNQLSYLKCEDEGLGTYSQKDFPKVKKLLTKCLSDAGRTLPQNQHVPLYLGATAGMRLLELRNKTIYNSIWKIVNSTLDKSQFNIKTSRTISGGEEAQWAWVAANYLKKSLKATDTKYGVIDLGSSSIQISFVPKSNESIGDGIKVFDVEGTNTSIYGHSYLCYGKREMERRFLAQLINTSTGGSHVENPCYFKGFAKNVTSEYLWKQPCSSGQYARDVLGGEFIGPPNKVYTLLGTADAAKCSAKFDSLINLKCTKPNCGMGNIFQPQVNGQFLALSVFQYVSSFMMISSNANMSVFSREVKSLCSKSWNQIKLRDIPGTSIKYRSSRCFDATYALFLLKKGFKFDEKTWLIQYTNKINSENVAWSLGLIYTEKENMYNNIKSLMYLTITRKPGLIGIIIIGSILLIIGGVLFIVTCIARRNAHVPKSIPNVDT